MSALVFYLSLPFLYLFSLLPFPVLYLISDLLWRVIYYLLPYRKKIVLANLRSAFPEKTEKERRAIARKFYRHFTDLVFEILKMRTTMNQLASRRPDMYSKIVEPLSAPYSSK